MLSNEAAALGRAVETIAKALAGQIIGNISWDENNIVVNRTVVPAQSVYLKQNGQTTGVVNVLLGEIFAIGTAASAIVFESDITAPEDNALGFDVVRVVDINVLDTSIGLLADLTTENKSSVVQAVNELRERINVLEAGA